LVICLSDRFLEVASFLINRRTLRISVDTVCSDDIVMFILVAVLII
jgi:hypothetical protein